VLMGVTTKVRINGELISPMLVAAGELLRAREDQRQVGMVLDQIVVQVHGVIVMVRKAVNPVVGVMLPVAVLLEILVLLVVELVLLLAGVNRRLRCQRGLPPQAGMEGIIDQVVEVPDGEIFHLRHNRKRRLSPWDGRNRRHQHKGRTLTLVRHIGVIHLPIRINQSPTGTIRALQLHPSRQPHVQSQMKRLPSGINNHRPVSQKGVGVTSVNNQRSTLELTSGQVLLVLHSRKAVVGATIPKLISGILVLSLKHPRHPAGALHQSTHGIRMLCRFRVLTWLVLTRISLR